MTGGQRCFEKADGSQGAPGEMAEERGEAGANEAGLGLGLFKELISLFVLGSHD